MMILSRIALAVMLTVGARTAFAADGMSIDCATSTEPFASAVCSRQIFRELDQQITALYKKLTDTLKGAPLAEVKRTQREWWQTRSRSTDGLSVITNLTGRLAALKSYEAEPILVGTSFSIDEYNRLFSAIDKKLGERPSDARLDLFMADGHLYPIEYEIRSALVLLSERDYNGIVPSLATEAAKDNYTHLDQSQAARVGLLYAVVASHSSLDTVPFIDKYCVNAGMRCDRSILRDEKLVVKEVLRLGKPVEMQRQELTAQYLDQVLQAVVARTTQIAEEEKAAREAEARRQQEERDRQARIAAEAARQRQAELERQARLEAEAQAREKARQEAAAAAERQATEEEAHRLHRTFRYQVALFGGALVDSVKLVVMVVPGWVYPVAAALGWLLHRHLALRLTLALATFAVLAYHVPGIIKLEPLALLTYLWQSWTHVTPDADPTALSLILALSYVPLLIALYPLAWILVGKDARAAELYRWGTFMPRWMHAGRYALAERWAEGAARRRQLRAAKFEAKLAAVQMQAQSPAAGAPTYPYAYPPPPRGGIIRGFFDFSRGVLSLVKWAIAAGLAYAFVKYGDSILDKGLLLIDKASGLANNVMPFFR